MEEESFLLFRVRLHLIELNHARLNRLLVSDAAFVRVPHPQLV